jgi:DNA repair protein SbcC/Rad50
MKIKKVEASTWPYIPNKRLKVLDDRYLLDLPGKEEDKSLCIVDTHMGDLRRSVKSLSGGETFLISLALALALSYHAARKVELLYYVNYMHA